MSTIATGRKAVKVSRSVRVLVPFDAEGKNAEIEITQTRGKKAEVTRYWVDRFPADFGTAFLVEKQGDGTEENEEYDVNLNGQESSCECLGFLRWNRCKHVDALAILIERKKL